jgi:hypothetical protein
MKKIIFLLVIALTITAITNAQGQGTKTVKELKKELKQKKALEKARARQEKNAEISGNTQTNIQTYSGFVSKKGIPILPEQGDWAIGVDAAPFFTYAGNMLNGNAFNTSPNFLFTSGTNLYGKYFVSKDMAFRGKLRLGLGSASNKAYSVQDGQTDPAVTVEDKQTISNTNVVLCPGIEMRKGKGRVQGFYGAELMISLTGTKTKYEYGNGYTTTVTVPTSHNFGTNIIGAARTTESKTGSTIGFGLAGFIGAEYFIAPKFSIGGEFQWGPSMSTTGDGELTSEAWDGANACKKTSTTKTGGASSLSIDNKNVAGTIYIMFHF